MTDTFEERQRRAGTMHTEMPPHVAAKMNGLADPGDEAPAFMPRRKSPSVQTEPDPRARRLTLRYGTEALAGQGSQPVVKGLLHADAITMIFGEAKSGKSFIVLDLLMAVAAGDRAWMGHRITRPGAVLYLPYEGQAGIRHRLSAMAQKRGMGDAVFPPGFIVADGATPLVTANGSSRMPAPEQIIAALDEAKARGHNVGVVAVDTMGMALGSAEVNAASDVAVFFAAMKAIAQRGVAVLVVHHKPKGGDDPAGSYAIQAGVDVLVHVRRTDSERSWAITRAKDGAETSPRAFSLRPVVVGHDADGDEITSMVVEDAGQAKAETKPRKASRKEFALRVLADVLNEHGEAGAKGMPDWVDRHVKSVSIERWRRAYYERGTPGEKQEAKRQAFLRASRALVQAGQVLASGDVVWLPQTAGAGIEAGFSHRP